MDNDYKAKVKWLEKNQIDVKDYPVSFSLDWKGWKLVNERPFITPNGYRNMDKYLRAAKDFQYKMVSRSSSRFVSNYLFMFATEENESEIPFYMLNKDEIKKAYKKFADRVGIDRGSNSILFSLDDGIRFKMYNYQIEKNKNYPNNNFKKEITSSFLKELLPRSIFYGDFDPDPLVTMKNGRVRLVMSKEIPRWYTKK
jgi:hypothetical protein